MQSNMAYTLSLVAKMGAALIFNRISRVDVNISFEELFRSNIEDRGNDIKLVKVKVGEERGGPWSDIESSETVQTCKDMQLRCVLFVCGAVEPEEDDVEVEDTEGALDGIKVLMSAAKDHSALPKMVDTHTNKHKMYNDLIKMVGDSGLGFHAVTKDTEGAFVIRVCILRKLLNW